MTDSDEGIVGIFGPLHSRSSSMAQSISEYLEIPHIQIHEKAYAHYQSKMSLNFYPDPVTYSEALAAVLRRMDWKKYTILYEDNEGLVRLQEILKVTAKTDNPVTVKALGPGPDYRPLLKEVKNSTDNRIILDCDVSKILKVLRQAKEIDMLELHHGYLLTSLVRILFFYFKVCFLRQCFFLLQFFFIFKMWFH